MDIPSSGDGQAWLDSYRRRIEDLRVRADRAQSAIAALTATATSPEGAVSVTVGSSGALTGLVFGPVSAGMDRERLATLIVSTTAEAAAEVARQAGAALTPLLQR